MQLLFLVCLSADGSCMLWLYLVIAAQFQCDPDLVVHTSYPQLNLLWMADGWRREISITQDLIFPAKKYHYQWNCHQKKKFKTIPTWHLLWLEKWRILKSMEFRWYRWNLSAGRENLSTTRCPHEIQENTHWGP